MVLSLFVQYWYFMTVEMKYKSQRGVSPILVFELHQPDFLPPAVLQCCCIARGGHFVMATFML